jgi:pyroglutamyl-peptidase
MEKLMKTLLITGFEPFGGETLNPSWEAILRLPDKIGNYTLKKLCIPVVFGEAANQVLSTAKECSPDAILCIGQAGGRAAITPEVIGINLRYANIPDNNGNRPQDEPIHPGGAAAYFCTLPARKIAAALQGAQLSSQVSYSAGTYVCNDVIYSLLAHFSGSKTRVGFIHIPYCEEQNKSPSMPLTDIIKGLTIAIENI